MATYQIMRIQKERIRLILITFTLLALTGGCGLWSNQRGPYGPSDPETTVPKTALPAQAPVPHALEFTESTEAGHLRPKVPSDGAPAPVNPSTKPIAVISPTEEAKLQEAALQDQRVRDLLGTRFSFIEADVVKPEWKAGLGCCATSARLTKLVYYSHSNNVAIEVLMKDERVASAGRREGYIPPEGDQEIQEAVELAKQDARLAGKLQGLKGRALLMEPERGVIWNDPGYGHRVLWVTFERNDSGDPEFWAIVDLSDQKVLDAGAEPKR